MASSLTECCNISYRLSVETVMLDEPAQGKEKTERTEPAHPSIFRRLGREYRTKVRLVREMTD